MTAILIELARAVWFRIVPSRSGVISRHVLRRDEVENDPWAKRFPHWMHHIMIGGFREQGWAAYDQNQNGKHIASGEWGEDLLLLSTGEITTAALRARASTEGPRE